MIKESKYCCEVMKKYFNKELLMTKEDNENLKSYAKCSTCDNDYVDNDAKVRDHCIITSLENIEALHIKIVISILD